MYQQVTIVGNVGSDAEMRFTPQGTEVASFSVAVNRKWGDSDDQQKTVWFRVTAWRKLAEVVGQYVKKGMKVLVVGEIEPPRTYQTKNGDWVASLEITAQTVRFLSRADEEENDDDGVAPRRVERPAYRRRDSYQRKPDEHSYDEDIPF